MERKHEGLMMWFLIYGLANYLHLILSNVISFLINAYRFTRILIHLRDFPKTDCYSIPL